MNRYSARIPGCRIAGHVLVVAAVIGLSGCIPIDNSFLRTSLYVMALERAAHGEVLANRVPVQRDDCERYDQLYFMCRYSGLTAFLSPAADPVSPVKIGADVTDVHAQTLGTDMSRPDIPDIQVAARGDRIAPSAISVGAVNSTMAVRAGPVSSIR